MIDVATHEELYSRLTGKDFIVYLVVSKDDPFKRSVVYRNLNGLTGTLNSMALSILGITVKDLPKIVPATTLINAVKTSARSKVVWNAIDVALNGDIAISEGSFGTGFNFKGSVQKFSDLPLTGNVVGDIYQVVEEDCAEYIWIEKSPGVFEWELLGRNVDLSQYATSADLRAVESKIGTGGQYTAFEVYANGSIIEAGVKDDNLGGNGTPNVTIPASRTHRLRLRTAQPDIAKCDVVIEWGDDQRSIVADGDYVSTSFSAADNERKYVIEHTYAEDGKYIVKIYGCQYYSICTPGGSTSDCEKYNLICRVFDTDLPLASNVTNISSFCAFAIRLLSVRVPSYYDFSRCINIHGIFRGCRNLQSVKGLQNQFLVVNAAARIFADCGSLTELDFTMPAAVTRGQTYNMFQGLSNFEGNIESLIPAGGFLGGTLDANNIFNGCAKMTGIVPAELFWANKRVKWINTSTAFVGCSPEIRAQVPVSWGGTNTNEPEEDVVTVDNKVNVITGGSVVDPVSINLEAGKFYLATSPFTATLPESPPVGSVIRFACTEGQENMKIVPSGNDTISGSPNPCIIGVSGDGSLVNNEFFHIVYSSGNWVLF